mmetsp:Transcript_67333/g.101505  ORF Transcript_67333/g.101505 Transcript_67333/m.101505 type:complete len:236 (+) Transcript_67333:721-1428(+)
MPSHASNIIRHKSFNPLPVALLTHRGCPSGKPNPSRIISRAPSKLFLDNLSIFVATTTIGTPMSYNAAKTARSSSLGTRRISTNNIPSASSSLFPRYLSAAICTDSLDSLLSLAYPKPGRSTSPSKGTILSFRKMPYKFTEAVAPGVFPTLATGLDCAPAVAILFSKLLFPTFDLPKNAISGAPSLGGNCSFKYAPKKSTSSPDDMAKRFQARRALSSRDKKLFDILYSRSFSTL